MNGCSWVKRHACEQRLDHDLGVAEPVERFTPVQHHLQCPDGQAEQREAEQIEAPGTIDRRLMHKRRQPEPGEQAERQGDVEDPAPVVVLGQPATERRPEDGPDHHAHTPHRHGRPVPVARVGVQENRLRQRHQARAEHALQQAEQHDLRQGLRGAAQHRRERETDHRPHEQSLAADACGQEACQRHADGRGHDVGSEHPGDLVLSRSHRALHVRQRDVRDRRVQRLHDGGQHHGDRDERAIRGLWLCHGRCHHLRATSPADAGDARCPPRPWCSGPFAVGTGRCPDRS